LKPKLWLFFEAMRIQEPANGLGRAETGGITPLADFTSETEGLPSAASPSCEDRVARHEWKGQRAGKKWAFCCSRMETSPHASCRCRTIEILSVCFFKKNGPSSGLQQASSRPCCCLIAPNRPLDVTLAPPCLPLHPKSAAPMGSSDRAPWPLRGGCSPAPPVRLPSFTPCGAIPVGRCPAARLKRGPTPLHNALSITTALARAPQWPCSPPPPLSAVKALCTVPALADPPCSLRSPPAACPRGSDIRQGEETPRRAPRSSPECQNGTCERARVLRGPVGEAAPDRGRGSSPAAGMMA